MNSDKMHSWTGQTVSLLFNDSALNGQMATVSDETSYSSDTSSSENKGLSKDRKRSLSSVADDDDKLEAKREYNRMNAARARKRHKNMVADLKTQLAERTAQLEKEQNKNAVLQGQLNFVMEQNRGLLNQKKTESTPVVESTRAGSSCTPSSTTTVQIPASLQNNIANTNLNRANAPPQNPTNEALGLLLYLTNLRQQNPSLF